MVMALCCSLCGMEQETCDKTESFDVFNKTTKSLYELGYRQDPEYFVVELGENTVGFCFRASNPPCKVVEPNRASVPNHVLVHTIKKFDLFTKNNAVQDYIETFKDKVILASHDGRIVYDLRPIEWVQFRDSLSESGLSFVANQFESPAWRRPKNAHPIIGGIALVCTLFFLWRYLKK